MRTRLSCSVRCQRELPCKYASCCGWKVSFDSMAVMEVVATLTGLSYCPMETAISDGWVLVLVSHHVVVVPKPAPLAMRGNRVSLPFLPPELWIYIHRLAIEDVSPLRKAYREIHDPVNIAPDALDVLRFLKAARSLMSVCKLWNVLAQELLYENVWLTDARRWASLSAALQRPDVARHVRSLRLSTARYDHNVEALCYCPQVEMLYQPDYPRPEYLDTAPDVPLPRLQSLKYLYWAESEWSSALLENVLSAAPNLEHIFLFSSGSIPSAATPIELPNLPHLKSLGLTWLNSEHVFAILRTDLQHLTHLTIDPVYLEWDAVPALPALTSLALNGYPEEALVSYSTICARCPALRELRYDADFTPEPPAVGQTAPALTYIQLHLWVPRSHSAYSHFLRFFEAPAFAALERVVLEGPGWVNLAQAHVKLETEPLRAPFAALLHFTSRSHCSGMLKPAPPSPVCVQERPLVPEKNGALWSELTALHATDTFLMRAAAQLSAAIQISTETFDEMGPGPDMPRKLKKAILRADRNEKALKERRCYSRTACGRHIISGGVKSNALPEQALVVVNHRIATTSSINAITTRDAELTKELAARFNLSVTAYGELLTPADAPAYGALSLSALRALEPAPVTPSVAPLFRLLAGSIRATFAAAGAGKDTEHKEVFVSPGMMTRNTDTRFNWKLSKHIFRYGHSMIDVSDLNGLHSIRADAFVEMIMFFTTLILNADEAEL
ncbi:hypothetical protein GGX14DRAFT_667815 [Mycena pura]|uniref:Uncharacterized protein n=1 Tax=Mycena pura TaxID=153505 RepID=A0AAD6UY70_9AGAR|nr:hypothetical protein GGX14DRAFT_667815 [Mycena pura]